MPAQGLRDKAASIKALPKAQTIAAAKKVKRTALDEARGATGGDLRLSNMGRRGARLRAVDTVKGDNPVFGKVVGLPFGAWSLITDGAKPHRIARRRGRTRARGRLAIGGTVRTGPFSHPGTHGKGVWRNVRQRSRRDIRRSFNRAVTDALR